MFNEFAPQSCESDGDLEVHDPFKNFKFTRYLKEEVIQSIRKKQYEDGTSKQGPFTNRAYTFITIPRYLESFMTYGILQCLDHLLVIYTFLPLRCLLTVLNLIIRMSNGVFQFCISFDQYHGKPCSKTSRLNLLYNYELRDLITFSLLCICTVILTKYDSSMAYHEIRTQSVIKIYIFFNLLEVADRLLSAVCQDALDDLSYTISKPRSDPFTSSDLEGSGLIFWRDVILQYCFAFLCLIAHCFLLLCQVTTLNVAFNSQNKSLITVFISNNFVELKGNVFRKMGKTNLFQIACADVRERFHYFVWFSIIVCRNMNESGWNLDDLQTILIDVTYILLAEIAVDWVKHSFITKFNVIPSNVYEEYTVSIAYDLLLCRQGKNTSDHFDLLSRRMGLTPIPLSCLINAMIFQTIRNPSTLCLTLPFVVSLLFAVKILTNLTLMSMAYSHVRDYINAASNIQQDENCFSNNERPVDVSTVPEKEKVKRNQHHFEKEILISPRNPPFGFTGYDQPTRDEDNFLPTGLRYRKFKSDSGSVDITTSVDIVHSLASDDSSEYPGNKPKIPTPVSTRGIWNELIESYQSIMASPTGTPKSLYEPNELAPLTPVSRIGSANRILNFGNSKSEIECERSFYGSCVFPTEDKLKSTSTPTTLYHEGPKISNRYEVTGILCADLLGNKDDSFTAMVRPPSACALLRPRYYSIDLGILSTFLRSMECSTHITDEAPIADGNVPESKSKLICTSNSTRKRRIRTMTESSGTAPSHPPRDPTIPILWERSSRNSTINQFGLDQLKPITPGRVKQPLSDIDRYSMVEGQIS
ncbi:hypothetical protein MN116_006263 [Schistosoma mekongi]|uniref:Protein TAPT1-like protein n=1 Tax=Schistosoma mekongi TaxID=38744 RepID=A0AAE2D434_SCHME|nr:hypothetical protein MN116_006263 [Schistosoma mekongi]